MKERKPGKRLVSTYVVRRPSGKFDARVVDGRTRKEGRCTKEEIEQAISCSRAKVIP
jgi:hypothetical protein